MNGEQQNGIEHKRISMELMADGAKVTHITMEGNRLILTIEAELADSHLVSQVAAPSPGSVPSAPRKRRDTELVARPDETHGASRPLTPPAPVPSIGVPGSGQDKPVAAPIPSSPGAPLLQRSESGNAPHFSHAEAADLLHDELTETWDVNPPSHTPAPDLFGYAPENKKSDSARGITLGDDNGGWGASGTHSASGQSTPPTETWDHAAVMPGNAAPTAEGGNAVGGMRHGEPQPGISFGMDAAHAPGIQLDAPAPKTAPMPAQTPGLSLGNPAPGISFDTPTPAPAPGLSFGEPAPIAPGLSLGGTPNAAPGISFNTPTPVPGPGLSLGEPAPSAPGLSLSGTPNAAPGISFDTPTPAPGPGLSLGESAPIAPGLSLGDVPNPVPGISFDTPTPAPGPGLSLGEPAPIAPGLSLGGTPNAAPGIGFDTSTPAPVPGLGFGDPTPIAPGLSLGGTPNAVPGIGFDTPMPAPAPGLGFGDPAPIAPGLGLDDASNAALGIGFDAQPPSLGPGAPTPASPGLGIGAASAAAPGLGFDTPGDKLPSHGQAPEENVNENALGGLGFGNLGMGEPPAPEFSSSRPEQEMPTQPAFNRGEAQEKPQAPDKGEAGGTTVLIRYTCPKCKTQGMQAVDRVGTVVNCSNCGKAMRLVMKK